MNDFDPGLGGLCSVVARFCSARKEHSTSISNRQQKYWNVKQPSVSTNHYKQRTLRTSKIPASVIV